MHFDHFGVSFETCTMILMQLLYAPSSMGLLDLIRKYYIKPRNTATQFKWNDKVKLFKSFIWWAMCLWQKNISLVSHLTLQKLLVGDDHGDAHKKDKERKIAFEFYLILLLFKTFSTLFTKSFVLSAIFRLWW